MFASFRAVAIALVLVSAAFSSACSQNSTENVSGACDAACPAGQVCSEGTCRALCESDTHCPGGQVCTSEGVCVTPADSGDGPDATEAPKITEVDGTGTLDGNGGHSVHHLRARLLLTGENLQDASGALQDKATGAWQTLSVAANDSASSLAFYVPATLSAGEYVLRVTNEAGSDEAEVWLLQGEPGLPGNVTVLAAIGDSASTGNVRSIVVDGVATESEYLGDDSTAAGLYVLLFDLETHAVATDPAPQVYDATQYAALATLLESVADTAVVLVASAGDVTDLSDALIDALQDVGASDALTNLDADAAYALVGRGGSGLGAGIETVSTDDHGIAYAATLAIERTLLGATQGSATSPFGTLEEGKLCQYTGGVIACTASAQNAATETDPTVNSLAKATLTGCDNGEVVKWNGAWGCASDETGAGETQVDAWVANNGYLSASDVNDLATATLTCSTDDVATYGAEGWTCLPLPESTSVNALATAALNCAAGEFAEYNGSHWGCAEPPATGNTLAYATLNCAAGEFVEYNGSHWGCAEPPAAGNTLANATLNCAAGQTAEYNGTAWNCTTGPSGVAAGFGLELYGDGSDGNATIAGTTTLARDMFYDHLTVSGTLNTNGFRVFVRATLTNTGTIANNGGHGSSDAVGAGGASGTVGGGGAGGPESASNAGSTVDSFGGSGGAGAPGSIFGSLGTATVPGATKGTLRAYAQASTGQLFGAGTVTMVTGGGGGAAHQTNFGGTGGGGGGVVVIVVRRLVNNGNIQAIGGNGFDGSGGGGGGVVILVYGSRSGAGGVSVAGGAGGSLSGSGGAGGTVFELKGG